ncbi:hypothetical protein BS47DRAFT_1365658 [Hydnum rufescens UP504]|uniref:Amidohydrolase n=1 Tax=Hydnum rufescens UP504 TaxID=1448309 RepID=A0A9P6DPC4_9AGAM|nr:hypothetical protein BS47DRAFT_1365658 [Hydnum rufescens UP504]
MDACLMMHPTPGPKLSGWYWIVFGNSTDRGGLLRPSSPCIRSPVEGQNALDAAFLAYSSISVLRQQMKVDPYASCSWDRGGTGLAPNIIPDYAKMRWVGRAPTAKEVEVFAERVKKFSTSEFAAVMKHYGGVVIADVPGAAGGSTDFGNVTYELPALHPSFAIPTVKDGGNHNTPIYRLMAAEKDITPGCLQPLFSMITSKVRGRKKSSPEDDCVAKNIAEPKVVFQVLRTKICTLEECKEAPPPQYASVDKTSTFCPPVLKAVDEYIDLYNEELWELNQQIHGKCTSPLRIHRHFTEGCPELAFKEEYAHKVLTEFMEAHGFSVTRHYLGLETAWRAAWSNVSPSKTSVRTIGFNSEMDALPGIGHACGHNLIAIGGVAAALGTKHAMEKCGIEGRVVLLGTPGCILLQALNEVPYCVVFGASTDRVEYYGHPAHAGRAPWEGRNALDAAVVAYSSISALRQQMKVGRRIVFMGLLRDGTGPRIVRTRSPSVLRAVLCMVYMIACSNTDNSKMRWAVRAPTTKENGEFTERVKECFKAGALATACTMTLTAPPPVQNLRQNSELASEFAAAMNLYGSIAWSSPNFAIPTVKDGGNQYTQFTKSAETKEAHDITITVAKCIALTGLRVLSDGAFLPRSARLSKNKAIPRLSEL